MIEARKASFAMTFKFDELILPILLYGCEVWGFEDLSHIKMFHSKFLRAILNVNQFTRNCMIYGETGRTKIDV